MERDAVISDCQKYRYLLRRAWDHEKPRALFVMLNPSTADAAVDDPTIRSCIRLTTELGYGSFEVVNLFAWRATDPKDLGRYAETRGPDNDMHIAGAIQRADKIICAWGANGYAYIPGNVVIAAIKANGLQAWCLGKTKDGAPKHPLYIKSGTALEVYRQ
jgi:hypothetical protein